MIDKKHTISFMDEALKKHCKQLMLTLVSHFEIKHNVHSKGVWLNKEKGYGQIMFGETILELSDIAEDLIEGYSMGDILKWAELKNDKNYFDDLTLKQYIEAK